MIALLKTLSFAALAAILVAPFAYLAGLAGNGDPPPYSSRSDGPLVCLRPSVALEWRKVIVHSVGMSPGLCEGM